MNNTEKLKNFLKNSNAMTLQQFGKHIEKNK